MFSNGRISNKCIRTLSNVHWKFPMTGDANYQATHAFFGFICVDERRRESKKCYKINFPSCRIDTLYASIEYRQLNVNSSVCVLVRKQMCVRHS